MCGNHKLHLDVYRAVGLRSFHSICITTGCATNSHSTLRATKPIVYLHTQLLVILALPGLPVLRAPTQIFPAVVDLSTQCSSSVHIGSYGFAFTVQTHSAALSSPQSPQKSDAMRSLFAASTPSILPSYVTASPRPRSGVG